jgi:catechol 2,3-dioxygenase-like lactoylglutathione lyase family enzyme
MEQPVSKFDWRQIHMQIKLASVFVDDQEKALRFYTEVLGFEKKQDVSNGPYRWLTVGAADGSSDMQLLLEPNAHPAARQFQAAIYADGIPATLLYSSDFQRDYERLRSRGVHFKSEPVSEAWGSSVIFDDTCGNWINLVQV